MTRTFDAIVIGGGSAGVSFARTAAGLGAAVCLIEKDALGGTCINRGCVPKKLMWHAAWTLEQARAACAQGLGPAPPPPDFAALQHRIGRKLDGLRKSYGDRLNTAGVTVLRGEASIPAADRVEIAGDTLTCRYLVLATGATPERPPLDATVEPETSDDVFGWTTLPRTLALIGGGYIGCEFGSVFSGLGTQVTLIDTSDRLLSGFDADIADLVRQVLVERGVDIRLGAKPVALRRSDHQRTLRFEDAAQLTVDRVVVATGRAPRTHMPGGFTQTLTLAETGAFAVDSGLQTSQSGVYAVGDCADRLPLTPVATRDGEALARSLFGDDAATLIDLALVARAAFVMPPVAQVGDPSGAEVDIGHDLVDSALSPPQHWTTRTASKTATGAGQLRGVAALGSGAPDIVSALGVALAGGDPGAATGIHPSFAEEFIGRG